MADPTADNRARAHAWLTQGHSDLHASLAAMLDAAELRGHQRAVSETAIASVHKAVAAERAAVVRHLREWASVGRIASADDYADEIERGDHHPKDTP